MRLPPRFGTGGGFFCGTRRRRRAAAIVVVAARAVGPQRLRCSGSVSGARAAAAPTTRLPRCANGLGSTSRQRASAAAAQPPPSVGDVSAKSRATRSLRPRARRRAPRQSTDHSAMSFGGSQPRQPHGREVSAEFRKRFAGRVNRTGRDGQLENYSRVRPGAHGAIGKGARGVADPAGPARAGAVGARPSRGARRGPGPTRAARRRRGRWTSAPAGTRAAAAAARNYDPLETATSTLNVDDDYAAAVDDVYEAVEAVPSEAPDRAP